MKSTCLILLFTLAGANLVSAHEIDCYEMKPAMSTQKYNAVSFSWDESDQNEVIELRFQRFGKKKNLLSKKIFVEEDGTVVTKDKVPLTTGGTAAPPPPYYTIYSIVSDDPNDEDFALVEHEKREHLIYHGRRHMLTKVKASLCE